MAAIYNGDIYCDACAEDIKKRIANVILENGECPDGADAFEFEDFDDLLDYLECMDERNYDSGEFPKHCDDGEESDSPEHCGSHEDCLNPTYLNDGSKVGHFFGNALTSYGQEYVKEMVNENLKNGRDSVAVMLWMPYYDYIDYDEQCATCGEYAAPDEYGNRHDCS